MYNCIYETPLTAGVLMEKVIFLRSFSSEE